MSFVPVAVTVKAHAKINLTLDVLAKRPDGFHEVSMLMQSLALHDTVHMSPAAFDIELTCDRPELACDSSNLAYRAAALIRQEFSIQQGVRIHLEKRIPVAAGLAGGSSDAAAVLKGLDRMWNLRMPKERLECLAAKLGSDVPFCLWGGLAKATGRGEILEHLPDAPAWGVVLIKPPFEVSTAWAYQNFSGATVRRRPDEAEMRLALAQGNLARVASQLVNVLESVTLTAYPELAEYKKRLQEAGAEGVLMSGSGPTIFGLTADAAKAGEVAGRLHLDSAATILATETAKREGQ